jgi:hypothetical protein
MLGKLSILNPPDIDGPDTEAFPGRGDASYGLRMGRRMRSAGDDPVARNNAILNKRLAVGHQGEQLAKVLDLGPSRKDFDPNAGCRLR